MISFLETDFVYLRIKFACLKSKFSIIAAIELKESVELTTFYQIFKGLERQSIPAF